MANMYTCLQCFPLRKMERVRVDAARSVLRQLLTPIKETNCWKTTDTDDMVVPSFVKKTGWLSAKRDRAHAPLSATNRSTSCTV